MTQGPSPAVDRYLASVRDTEAREADGFGLAPAGLVEDDRIGALVAATVSTLMASGVIGNTEGTIDLLAYVRWVGEPGVGWPLTSTDPFAHVDLIRAVVPRFRIEGCDRCGAVDDRYGLVTVVTPPNFVTLIACGDCVDDLGLSEAQYVTTSGPA